MSKLMELVEEYGSRQLACGVMHMPSGAMKSGELLSEIRAAVAELERDAARYRWLRTRLTVSDVTRETLRDGHSPYNGNVDAAIDGQINAAMEADK